MLNGYVITLLLLGAFAEQASLISGKFPSPGGAFPAAEDAEKSSSAAIKGPPIIPTRDYVPKALRANPRSSVYSRLPADVRGSLEAEPYTSADRVSSNAALYASQQSPFDVQGSSNAAPHLSDQLTSNGRRQSSKAASYGSHQYNSDVPGSLKSAPYISESPSSDSRRPPSIPSYARYQHPSNVQESSDASSYGSNEYLLDNRASLKPAPFASNEHPSGRYTSSGTPAYSADSSSMSRQPFDSVRGTSYGDERTSSGMYMNPIYTRSSSASSGRWSDQPASDGWDGSSTNFRRQTSMWPTTQRDVPASPAQLDVGSSHPNGFRQPSEWQPRAWNYGRRLSLENYDAQLLSILAEMISEGETRFKIV